MADNTDGRTRRADTSRTALIDACRGLMVAGDFRPTALAIAREADLSTRCAFRHFNCLEALHREALRDYDTGNAILHRVLGAAWNDTLISADMAERLIHAAVFGRVPERAADAAKVAA